MRITKTRTGLALRVALATLGGAAWAQDAGDDYMDLTPPDMSAPRGDREYRTCPDREDRPAWVDELDGWEAQRGLLLMRIYEARSYERIVTTGDCSCATKAPSWDMAEAEYFEEYAALDLQAQDQAERDFRRLKNEFRREARRICIEQGNW